MPRTSKEIAADSRKLNKLIPSYASRGHTSVSAAHAEKRGDKGASSNSERKIGAHLLRLEKLLSRNGVEKRVWDSAVRELTIKEGDIPESYWQQQLQLARDNGLGDIHLTRQQKELAAQQLQDAQRTGLESWRSYLERSGNQYPVWFKVYAWEGMSHLGVFDQEGQNYRKRSKGTVAPYPLLNPAALARVYETVKDGDKTESFNSLYSRMLVEQRASISTPENPEDVRGEWREYTNDDIEAIAQAAQATPWCIAGERMAAHYTQDGGKFLLFHLQDPETGVYSPTACASIRLDASGNVVELSGLKGGSAQYLEDGIIPTVEEKVKTLPGGERYLEAFADKQMLVEMDKKFQAGESFTVEELLFLYEVDRPIHYLDTYAHDPRPDQFRRRREQHIQQLSEYFGSERDARTALLPQDEIDLYALTYIKNPDYNPDMIAKRIPLQGQAKFLRELLDAGATTINPNELFEQLELQHKLAFFDTFKEVGTPVDIDKIANSISNDQRLKYFKSLKQLGAALTADDIANDYSDDERLWHVRALKNNGATFDTNQLISKVHGSETDTLGNGGKLQDWLAAGASPSFMLKILKLNQYDITHNFSEGLGLAELNDIVKAVPASGIDQAAFIDQMRQKLADNKAAYLGTGGVGFDYLGLGFDVNVVAMKQEIDDKNLAEFMERGVDKKILLDGMTSRYDGRVFDGDENDYDRTYYVSKSIPELINYGCDIKDIAKHIAKQYQFDQFDTLQEYGAGLVLNEIVAGMRPGDVISKIAAIRERGVKVDINDILRKAKEGDVYQHMVANVMAAGADPKLVAEKMSTRHYVSEYGDTNSSEWRYLKSLKAKAPDVYEAFKERLDEAVQKGRAAKNEAYKKAREREQAELKAAQ